MWPEPCPRRDGEPHEWAGVVASGNGTNPCRFCGAPGRLAEVGGEINSGHFARATAARSELFSTLAAPASVKVWGKAP